MAKSNSSNHVPVSLMKMGILFVSATILISTMVWTLRFGLETNKIVHQQEHLLEDLGEMKINIRFMEDRLK